jgi:group I intron endonuclease
MPTDHAGIYSVANNVTHKVYVGSSVNVLKRIREHIWALKRGDHPNRHLQSAWNKYGEHSFEFSVLEHCSIRWLAKREQWWIEELQSNGVNGYNLQHAKRGKYPCPNVDGHKIYWDNLSEDEKSERVKHLVEPINRKGNSKRLLYRWRDPEFRAKRIAGLNRGREKTNSNPTDKMLSALSAGRSKALKRWKTDQELRDKQRANNLAQWQIPEIRQARLAALARGREKTNAKKKADAAARRLARQ